MGTLIQDLRYGVHMLHKFPNFTAVAVLALALGIVANTTISKRVRSILASKSGPSTVRRRRL